MNQLRHRKATLDDLSIIIDLYLEDDLGQHREIKAEKQANTKMPIKIRRIRK